MEIGAVHRLSDSDPTKSPSCQLIPRNNLEDREEDVCLGGRAPWDVGRGYSAQVRAILHRHKQRGV